LNSREIAKYGYFEAHILHRAAREGLLAPLVRAIEDEAGLPEGYYGTGVFYEVHVAGLLYCLIVVPKESWCLEEANPIYEEIGKRWSLERAEILISRRRELGNVYQFIRHLRNAIGHGNFEFRDQGAFEFWDCDPRSGVETYRARLSKEALEEFLETAGRLMAYYQGTRSDSSARASGV